MEFFGEDGAGKTQAVLHLVSNAVLPKVWRGIELQGKEVGVIVLDTEYHFCLLRLASILENRINFFVTASQEAGDRNLQAAGDSRVKDTGAGQLEYGTLQGASLQKQFESDRKQSGSDQRSKGITTEADVEALVKECLQRLFVVRCNSTTQLIMSLYSLDTLLSSKLDIALLVLDSASAFFWIDHGVTSDSTSAKNSPQQRTLAALQHLIDTFGVFTIVTRAAIFVSRPRDRAGMSDVRDNGSYLNQSNYLGRQWQQEIACTYTFSGCSNRKTLNVSFSPGGTQSMIKRKFSVTDYGLHFESS